MEGELNFPFLIIDFSGPFCIPECINKHHKGSSYGSRRPQNAWDIEASGEQT